MSETKKISVMIEAIVGDAIKRIDELTGKTKEATASTKELAAASKEAASGVKGLGDVSKGMQGLGDAASVASVAMGVFTGSLAKDVVEAFGAAIGEAINQIIDLGTKTQKTISQISAMKNFVGDATAAYREFNDVGRNTNFDLDTVQAMGAQLLNMGYSAKNAADLIQLCSDTAAGLNAGQAGAQQLVDVLSRIQSTGEMSSRQLISLQMAGMDLDKAFASVGMSAEEAMKAMDKGTLDAQTAIKALTEYMHEFDGSMEKSKNNVTDQWGDVCGNMQTIMGEIGAAIFDAFNQSGIIQELISFTQDLVDFVRTDGTGAFSDLKSIAVICLDAIETGLKVVLTAVKAVIVGATKLYNAFRTIGAKIANALSPILQPLSQIWNFVKSILSSLGQSVSEYVGKVWTSTFGGAPADDGDNENHFRTVKRTQKEEKEKKAGRSGGSGRKAAKEAITEEQRAIEALIKKYSDADKARSKVAKTAIELVKVNLSMMTGELKLAEERSVKLRALDEAHSELLDGYNKELALAEKINDEHTRDNVIKSIEKQIAAENDLYKAKVRQVNFESNMKIKGEETKNLLDQYFGTQDDIERKIKKVEDGIARIFNTANVIKSGGEGVFSNEDKTLLEQILQSSPEALQGDLATKSQMIAEFIDQNKTKIAEGGAALRDSLKETQNWGQVTVRYATMVGDAMADAMYDWITGAKSGKEALSDFVSSILKTAAQLLTRWLSLFAIFSIVGDPRLAARNASAAVFGAYDGKVLLHKATGGYISGPGTSTSDSIPAMLSNGEYVVKAEAVRKVGLPTLEAINRGESPVLNAIKSEKTQNAFSETDVERNSRFKKYKEVISAAGSAISKYATGGYISGPGTSVSDSISAMLSKGEYVIKASAVRRIGVPTLNAINTGRYHFADGGYVGGQKMQPAAPVGGNITLQVNTIDASDFDSFLNFRGGGERITNMLREAQRRFAFSFDD